MLTILLATCETTLSTLRAADNPVDRELTEMLERMVNRTRVELDRLGSDSDAALTSAAGSGDIAAVDSHENTRWVGSALRYVERGNACQNNFRMLLNANLLRQLNGHRARARSSVRQIVEETIVELNCQPKYDPRLLELEWLGPIEN